MNGSDFWRTFAVPFVLLVLFVIAIFAVTGMTKRATKAPTVDIISGNEIVTDQTEVPITGVVHDTTELTVGGKEVAVSPDGSFSTTVPVSPGENSVEIAAGSTNPTKTTVKVTREEPQKAVTTAATVDTTNAGLATSGPVETVMGSFGLAAILLSLLIYRRSMRGNPLQKA